MWNTLSREVKNFFLAKWQREARELADNEGVCSLSGNVLKYYLKGYIEERKEQFNEDDLYVEDEWFNPKFKADVDGLVGQKAVRMTRGLSSSKLNPAYIVLEGVTFYYSSFEERDADYRKASSILVQHIKA